MKKVVSFLTMFLYLCGVAHSADDPRLHPSCKAIILDGCPHLQITSFKIGESDMENPPAKMYYFTYHWKNRGKQDVTAFEIVTLKFSPFNEPLGINSFTVVGHNSMKHDPLKPGEEAWDGTGEVQEKKVHLFTALCYVRRVRLADGSIWHVDEKALRDAIKKGAPGIDPKEIAPAEKDSKGK